LDSGKGAMVDRQTFDRLMLDHLPGAQRFAIRLTGNPDVAEEIVQEALVRAAGAWASFQAKSSFRTWLFQVVVNVFRDRLRSRPGPRALNSAEDCPDRRAIDPAVTLEARELEATIAACVSSLPPRQCEVLVLMGYEQLKPREAAAVLGISEGNLRTTLHLARASMKKHLSAYLSEQPRET
jgi:RNA polymerase sigma-70 factor (ECF subfamily)